MSTKLLSAVIACSQTCCLSLLIAAPAVLADGGHSHHRANTQESDTSSRLGITRAAQFNNPIKSRSIRAADITLGQPAQFGQWSDVYSWPLIAVHANLLPNGKVLAWDATPDDFDDDPHTTDSYTTRVTLWDPGSNIHTPTVNDTNGDLFCAGSAQLWDGRVLFAGGDSGNDGLTAPLSNTNIYDPVTNTWKQAANMATPRWYSSVAALANGEMFTYAGAFAPDPIAEVFQLNETWRVLNIPATERDLSAYRWLQATPEGKVMSFGPRNTLESIDTRGTGALNRGPVRDGFTERRYGSYAMYDVGKVLVTGGTVKEGGVPSFQSSVIIDTATQQTTDTSDMIHGRTQHNLTILADGSVLATGGNSDGAAFVSQQAGIFQPEIWSPDSGRWRPMNDMQVDRQYHAIALLLPDGRVLSAGGGYCGVCLEIDYEEENAEVFSPPYLFSSGNTLAARPAITDAPNTMDYDQTYNVSVSSASTITKMHLIKLGAVTHSQNQDQRLVPLTFSRSNGVATVRSPENRNIAPPGHYMLFAVNQNGVPSVAKIIRVGQPLLESDTVVTNDIRPNESDEYVIRTSQANKTLTVKIAEHNRPIKLSVTGLAENNSDTAACELQNGGNFECKLANVAATRWKIKVDATSPTPYTLVASLSNTVDPDAEQPRPGSGQTNNTDNNGGVVRVGGGGSTAPAVLLWLLALCTLRRRTCPELRVKS